MAREAGRGDRRSKKLASESIQIIPIAKETTSQFPVSISALNSCFTYNLASLKDFNCEVKKSQSAEVRMERKIMVMQNNIKTKIIGKTGAFTKDITDYSFLSEGTL